MSRDAGVRSIPELRHFGKQMQQMGEQMYKVMLDAQKRMNYVSQGWQDDINDKFKERFGVSVNHIKKMSDEFTQYNKYIQSQCDILENYNRNNIKF